MNGFHVLMYHEIVRKEDFDEENNSWIKVNQDYHDILPKVLFVFLEEFEKQMAYLHENRYTILTLKDVIDFFYCGKSIPEKAVLITFDDMYKSVLLYAYPVLKRYGFSATGFVVLDWLFDEVQKYSSRQSVCLSKSELWEMGDVFEYACHSKALHIRKDGLTALQTVDRTAFCIDTEACRQFVNSRDAYAYPFGIFTDEIIQWLKESGFRLAFTTAGGKNTAAADPYKIQRDCIFLELNIDRFIHILI
ncbi:MAG: hypothetical protein FIA99_11660 [Ruminiclostridium sp.]|nr:hypothetical protein [Ruminiclostridium sp.]